jgi:penicillin-binding protein 2B
MSGMNGNKSKPLTRIRIISIGIFLFALLLLVRLYTLQIVHSEIYEDKADRQYSSTNQGVFSRGTIFFRSKEGTLVSAATLKSGFIVAINPEILKNPEDAYSRVNNLLPLDRDAFLAKAAKKNDPYEEIATRVDLDLGEKIKELRITGLTVFKERWRFYPAGEIGSHVVGILGYKGDEFAGRYGLERQFEENLERHDSSYTNFFAEIFAGLGSATANSLSSEADIVTTIEPTVASYLQNTLASTTEKWSAEAIGGIVMNPQTGEIYAMESVPTFDPNNLDTVKNVSDLSNPLVENVFEMGSIIKPLTVAAGIDAGVITSSSTYTDRGFVMVDGKKISNFDGKDRGVVGIQDLLSQSLNVGAAHVEKLLGNDRFRKYMYTFGLDEKTSIELPNEAKNITNLTSTQDIDYVTASFGQGMALTPISTIRALSVLANGGKLISPHVVKRVDYKLGISKEVPVSPGVQVLKKETVDQVAKLLTYSVDHVLNNGTLRLVNNSVAAKTGTAQIPKSNGGGYEEDKVLHSFVGYFPSYDPKFIILLYMVDPKGAHFGSETLTVPFMDLTNFLLNYYEIPPDR